MGRKLRQPRRPLFPYFRRAHGRCVREQGHFGASTARSDPLQVEWSVNGRQRTLRAGVLVSSSFTPSPASSSSSSELLFSAFALGPLLPFEPFAAAGAFLGLVTLDGAAFAGDAVPGAAMAGELGSKPALASLRSFLMRSWTARGVQCSPICVGCWCVMRFEWGRG